MENNPFLWYRDKDSLHLGDARRYNITYVCKDEDKEKIYLTIKNTEKVSIRAYHFLNGPCIFYCHVVPYGYDQNKEFKPDNPDSVDEVQFENQVKPGQAFNVTLFLNSNSFKENSEEGFPIYSWSIDILSQIYINKKTSVHYDLMVGGDMEKMKSLNRGPILNTFISLDKKSEIELKESISNLGESRINELHVMKQITDDLWPLEPKNVEEPVHLVILTHGIFSNLTADMLYVKDSLLAVSDENLLVTGYNGNSAKSEKGVKKLGTACSKFIQYTIEELRKKYVINKISFIGHSLGGLVQLYAIKHILVTEGADYFSSRNISAGNLVCLASPLLGVLSELNFFISLFLDIGSLGKTGRDLTLLRRLPNLKGVAKHEISRKRDTLKPLLEILPDNPLQNFLEQFDKLTLYANAVNDGIVPLRTSALLYLDYEALGDVNAIKKKKAVPKHNAVDSRLIKTTESVDAVGEISDNDDTSIVNGKTDAASDFMSLNIKPEASRESFSKVEEEDKKSLTDKESLESENSKSALTNTSPKSETKFIDFSTFTGGFSRRKKIKKLKKVRRINAKGSKLDKFSSGLSTPNNDSSTSVEMKEDEMVDDDSDSLKSLKLPPKASAIESALYTLICPVPKTDYITDPASRDPVIFHDRYYHFRNLPYANIDEPEHKHKVSTFGSVFFRHNEWKMNKQVKIAKKYHTPKMNWRKVLVDLPPDAHNNIIVRRRFPNGYGWGVIDHLCHEIFSSGNQGSMNSSLGNQSSQISDDEKSDSTSKLKPKI